MSLSSKLKYILILLLIVSSGVNAQRLLKLTVSINGETKHVPYIVRKGTEFVSAKGLAQVLAQSYYYNNDAAKLELKFPNYKIKFTARNQFVIIIKRSDNSQRIFQIPISTMLVKNDVLIPLRYCVKFLTLAYEEEIRFDDRAKHIAVTGKRINSLAYLDDISEPGEYKTPVPKPVVNSAYDVYGVYINEKSNGTLIRINSKKPLHKYRSSINEGILYLFLTDVTVEPNLAQRVKSTGLVRKVNVRKISGNTQLEFTLKEGYSTSEAFQDIGTNDLLITIHNELFAANETDFEANKDKWQFDVIVIDAGHGGKDPGAIGVSGVREKDVNLGIALKLGDYIEQNMSGVKVEYTRSSDKFVELYKRGKIANEAGGKLFVSIHCNSMPKKPSSTKGFEVYLLRPGRTKQAIAIAEFENSVINYEDSPDRYQHLTDENFILVSMAHSSYMRYSEKFSDILNQKWENYTNISSRGIKQAGFYVLVGASMPSVLIEAGFLSNRTEEAYLKSSRGQQEVARAIFESVKGYIEHYRESIEQET